MPRYVGSRPTALRTMSTDEYKVADPDLVEKFETDERGRITLGPEFADANVKVAVQQIDDDQ